MVQPISVRVMERHIAQPCAMSAKDRYTCARNNDWRNPMFFIGGITQGTKELVYNAAAIICGRCGRYGRYQVFMTYMCLSFFFIPIFKWNRKYYVKTSCCGTVYQLNEEVGKRIAAGEDISIREEDLTLVSEGHNAPAWDVPVKRCANCGYETKENFEYCPKCGKRF